MTATAASPEIQSNEKSPKRSTATAAIRVCLSAGGRPGRPLLRRKPSRFEGCSECRSPPRHEMFTSSRPGCSGRSAYTRAMSPSASSNTSVHLSTAVRGGENPVTPREVVFDMRRPRRLATDRRWRSAGVNARHLQERDHRTDRPLRLRQEHLHPLPEPDERPRRRGSRSTGRSSTTASTSTGATSIQSRFGGGSGWCSSGRTRSRSRSTTTSPSHPRSSAWRETSTSASSELCAGPHCGTRSRTGSRQSALGLSGGQQQRLCIARAIAVEPDVILLDEPASALDPISTSAIEDLMHELKNEYTLVIVTHNMQQAARVAEMTAFFSLDVNEDGTRHGDPGRVRRDRQDLHLARPTSAPRATSRDGSADDARLVPRGASTARGFDPGGGQTSSCARSVPR